MFTKLTIKSWAEDDRPREKMLLKGKNALSDAELIAILIGSGTPTKSAVQLGQEILQYCNNNLQDFSKLTIKELMQFKGIGEAKAISLYAATELGRRRKYSETNEPLRLTSVEKTYELLKPFFLDLTHEEFYVVYLSRSNKVLSTKLLSIGGRTGTIADGKIIFKEALALNACGIILAHNHPSGNLKPSDSDVRLTNELHKFGKMIDLQIIDHLIITDDGFFSFARNGLI